MLENIQIVVEGVEHARECVEPGVPKKAIIRA